MATSSSTRPRKTWSERRKRAATGFRKMTGTFECSICHQRFSKRDEENHKKAHAAVGDRKPRNVVEQRARAEQRRSQVVEDELARRADRARSTAPPPPRPVPPPTPAQRIRRRWGAQIDQRGAVMAGTTAPQSSSQQRNVAAGPAAGLVAAATAFTDAEPRDHEEMRDLMLAFHSAMETLARGVEAFQERQVNRGFHPVTMRPLDMAVQGIGDGATGFTQTLVAIERFYASNFEAAQNPGPGEVFFGATPVAATPVAAARPAAPRPAANGITKPRPVKQ